MDDPENRMNRKYANGLTMIELLITLAISFSLLGIVIPSTSSLLRKQRLQSSGSELYLLVTRARNDALTLQRRITLCPLNEQHACHDSWTGTLTVFTDPNGNRTLDPQETALSRIEVPSTVQLRWKGMKPANSMHFSPTGMTLVSNGTFTLCSKSIPEAIKLIINRQGRVRTERLSQACPSSKTT